MRYTITNVQPSINKNTGQQYVDQYGNRSFSVFLQDSQGQSTNILKRVKQGNPDPKVGDVLEGYLEMKTGKSGATYFTFVPEKKEFGGKGYSSDPNTMLLSYAKDVVVAMINHQPETTKLVSDDIKSDITTLTYHFKGLYEELKGEKPQPTPPEVKPQQNAPQDEIDINEIPWEG